MLECSDVGPCYQLIPLLLGPPIGLSYRAIYMQNETVDTAAIPAGTTSDLRHPGEEPRTFRNKGTYLNTPLLPLH